MSLKQFKILFQYFKDAKLKLSLYILFRILKYFETLLNSFFWSSFFQTIIFKNVAEAGRFFVMGISLIILNFIFIKLPMEFIFDSLKDQKRKKKASNFKEVINKIAK